MKMKTLLMLLSCMVVYIALPQDKSKESLNAIKNLVEKKNFVFDANRA
jgi:hypothetical protein